MRSCAIAFGIMCKAPVQGASKTRLCPPLAAAEAARLSACFLADIAETVADVVETAAEAGGSRAIAVYTGSRAVVEALLPERFGMLAQQGPDLSARLRHATSALLDASSGGVCLLNADSPTLPSAVLRQALAELRRPGDRIVLGPALDGGYYLIGLKQAYPMLFCDIAWSTSQVLAQTLTRLVNAARNFPRSAGRKIPGWRGSVISRRVDRGSCFSVAGRGGVELARPAW